MKTTLIAGRALSDEQFSAWEKLQRENQAFDSPFFHPGFTRAMASARDDVEVALLEQDGCLVGVFPFQRANDNTARPVGGRMSDFQGVVLKPGASLDAVELLRACGLSAWHFDHLIDGQAAFEPFQWASIPSPYIDTSRGWDAYFASRRDAGGQTLQKMARKLRKLEREVGPVRFELETADEGIFNTLGRWKSEQYQSQKTVDRFAYDWIRDLMLSLLKHGNAEFGGMMSAWYVNDELAAVHYGIRSNRVLHSWVPAYHKDMSKHSPGAQLLIEIIKASQGLGIDRIDLGVGDDGYKSSFMSGTASVGVGCVDSRMAAVAMRRAWHHTKHWVKNSRCRSLAETPWYMIRRVRDQIQFR